MPNDKEFDLDDLESFSFDDLSLDDVPPPEAGNEDPFGVWVKTAPEDEASGPEVPVPETGATPAEALDGLPEDDALSSQELAALDDSFDFVTIDDPLAEQPPVDEAGLADLDSLPALDGDAFFDEVPGLDDGFSLDPNPSLDDLTFDEAPFDAPAGPAPTGRTFDEVSLDDFVTFDDEPAEEAPAFVPHDPSEEPALAEEDQPEEFLDIDIDIEDDINDEELEIIEGAQARLEEPADLAPTSSFTAEEIDLSEFGDFEEVAPKAEGPLDEGEDLPEVKDFPEFEAVPAPLDQSADFDAIPDFSDLTLNADLPAPAEAAPDVPEDDFQMDDGYFEEQVLEDDLLETPLPSLEDEGPVALDLEPDDHTDLDHILALEEDLTAGIRTPGEAPASAVEGSAPGSDLAALILEKIESELSSIKQEITELKREVTSIRTLPPAPVQAALAPLAPPEAPAALAEVDADEAPHGFFDEEDDETIALTGDELDNILSTADISEGEEDGVSLDEDLLSLDAEGNLVLPESDLTPEVVHVTDEEFLAGTGLGDDEVDLGVPSSIELEEHLPEGLDDLETDDLLAAGPDLASEDLDIPFDADLGLDEAAGSPAVPEAWAEEPTFDDLTSLELEGLDEAVEPEEEPAVAAAPSFEPVLDPEPLVPAFEPEAAVPAGPPAPPTGSGLSPDLKEELKAVLSYMDKLLASLPDEKIQEFAESEHFEVYKKLFEELGIVE